MKPVDRDTGYVDPYVPKKFSHRPGSPRTEAMPSHLSSPSVKGKKELPEVGFPIPLKKVVDPRFCSPFTRRLLSHLMDPLQNISLSSCSQPHQQTRWTVMAESRANPFMCEAGSTQS